MNADPGNLTLLIGESRKGDRQASDQLFALVYDQLREIAAASRFVGRAGDTMQPTALANEAYLIFDQHFPVPPRDQPENRETFFRTVAQAMRTILRDYWRKKNASKRGGGNAAIALGAHDPAAPTEDAGIGEVDFLDLDAALDKLEQYNRRWCDVALHRYFAGRSLEETAEMMGVGLTTVKSDWQLARAWLRRELGKGRDDGGTDT